MSQHAENGSVPPVIGELPRGEDFANKFARGEWAETVLINTIRDTDNWIAFQYGVSRGDALTTKAELDDVKEANVTEVKRPDILVFHRDTVADLPDTHQTLLHEYATAEPDTRATLLSDLEATGILSDAAMALEAESSKWKARPHLSAYVKEEDYPRLRAWQEDWEVPIHVCQLFYDTAYIIPFQCYKYYANSAFNGECYKRGIEYGSIPNINKDGLIVSIGEFPYVRVLGEFTDRPRVVRDTETGIVPCEHTWTDHGQLDPDPANAHPFFKGGTLELQQSLADWQVDDPLN